MGSWQVAINWQLAIGKSHTLTCSEPLAVLPQNKKRKSLRALRRRNY
jgi:hypothetical protein